MQIHKLDGAVPVYTFIIAAIGFVLMAYVVRLTIMSSRLTKYKVQTMNQIREELYLQHDESVPTHVAMAWIGDAVRASVSKNFSKLRGYCCPWRDYFGCSYRYHLSNHIFFAETDRWRFLGGHDRADAVLLVPISIDWKRAGFVKFYPRDRLRSIQQYFEDDRRKKKKAERERKRKVNGHLEGLAEESTVTSAN